MKVEHCNSRVCITVLIHVNYHTEILFTAHCRFYWGKSLDPVRQFVQKALCMGLCFGCAPVVTFLFLSVFFFFFTLLWSESDSACSGTHLISRLHSLQHFTSWER